MINQDWAMEFAEESSRLIVERLSPSEGKLQGKNAMREYWLPSLSTNPPLRFELIDLFVGISELTILYKNIGRRVVAETVFINDSERRHVEFPNGRFQINRVFELMGNARRK